MVAQFKVRVDTLDADVYDRNGDEITKYFDSVRNREQHVTIYSYDAREESDRQKLNESGGVLTEFVFRAPLDIDFRVGDAATGSSETCNGAFVTEAGEETNATILARENYGTDGTDAHYCYLVGPLLVRYKVRKLTPHLLLRPWSPLSAPTAACHPQRPAIRSDRGMSPAAL